MSEPETSPLVLLAEDNEVSVETMVDFLKYCGYGIVVARDGQEAIDQAVAHLPDVILMDIQMPVMDGLQAIRILRENPRTKLIPIIALTGLVLRDEVERCMEAGADLYFSKPFSLSKLTESMKSLLKPE